MERKVFYSSEVSMSGGLRRRYFCHLPKAFTLVEILLVIVLISLLAGLAGVSYAGAYKKLLVEKDAKQLALAIKYGRILAVERQKKYIITLDDKTNSFFMMEKENPTQPISDVYSKPVKFSSGVVFEQIKIEPLGTEGPLDEEIERTISFQSDGTAQTAIVQIGNGDSHMTVSVDAATGRSKIYFGKAEDVKVRTIDLDDAWK